jgi:hypothetical protein
MWDPTVHSTQYTVHSTQYTVHSTQYTVHSTQYTVHSTQYALIVPVTLERWSEEILKHVVITNYQ